MAPQLDGYFKECAIILSTNWLSFGESVADISTAQSQQAIGIVH